MDKNLLTDDMVTELVIFWQKHHNLVADGMAGPKTRATFKSVPTFSTKDKQVHPLAWEALTVANRELGNGEETGNNRGPDVRRYRGDAVAAAWCAAFVSWCYEQAARDLSNMKLPFARSHGAKKLYKNIGKAGSFVSRPLPGDVVCWDRGKAGSWQGHIGFVVKVQGSTFWTIEGNVGAFPSKVAVYRHELDEARLVGFARL
jgi:hypothetical protein